VDRREDQAIADAQAELDRRRLELALDKANRMRDRGGLGSLAAALGDGVAAPAGLELVGNCVCGASLPRPKPRSLAICAGCVAVEAVTERKSVLLERIPERYRWASLDRPMVPPGGTAPVVLEEGRLAACAWILSTAQRILTVTAEVLNPSTDKLEAQTGAGKSTLLGGVARAAAELGVDIEWVPARLLDPTHPDQEQAQDARRRAYRASLLILDGLGKELGGASDAAGPGVAAQRKKWMLDFLHDFHEGRAAKRMAIGVEVPARALIAAYGQDSFRRIAREKDVTVIRLRRQDAYDYTRF